jgi:2-keto-4-pentenoate hydratase
VEALGNPVTVVTWLANRLAAFDREVRPGEIVLTGSLTNFFFLQPGDVMDIMFSSLGNIQFAVGG